MTKREMLHQKCQRLVKTNKDQEKALTERNQTISELQSNLDTSHKTIAELKKQLSETQPDEEIAACDLDSKTAE